MIPVTEIVLFLTEHVMCNDYHSIKPTGSKEMEMVSMKTKRCCHSLMGSISISFANNKRH